MRTILILAALALLPACLSAQQSGRHFHRPIRTQATAAVTNQATDAAATTSSQRTEPMRKLRSGRAWSSYHFSRLPQSPATAASPGVIDASSTRSTVRRSSFWGRILKG
jgi:hypothetical protein